jgi:streptogramin lyase
MKLRRRSAMFVFSLALLLWVSGHAESPQGQAASAASDASIGIPTTLVTLANDSEGLTVDPDTGLLYAAEAPDAAGNCFVRSITLTGAVSTVGVLPKPPTGVCSPRGLEFRDGFVYIADQGTGPDGWVFRMNPATGEATTFASGVPGANGIAFDSHGNLWITDSLRGLGRVFRRDAASGAVQEAFRVPPVGNGTTYGGKLTVPAATGIGRQIVNMPVGMQAEVRQVANGIAVVERYSDTVHTIGEGKPVSAALYIADTARGALWVARLDALGNLAPGQTGCNPTLQDNTLCEDAVFVAHPRLEGADGIWVDRDGSLLVAANSRQGLVRVDRNRNVTELFRNPLNSQMLRSSADSPEGNTHILEYPSNPVIVPGLDGHSLTICVASIDRPGRENWPGTVGEIGGPGQHRGKISCF